MLMGITYSGNIFFVYDEKSFASNWKVQIVDLRYELLFRWMQYLAIACPKRHFLNVFN